MSNHIDVIKVDGTILKDLVEIKMTSGFLWKFHFEDWNLATYNQIKTSSYDHWWKEYFAPKVIWKEVPWSNKAMC